MSLTQLPHEMLTHILQFLSVEEHLVLVSLGNRVLNTVLGRRLVDFYHLVYRFLPSGRWFDSRDQKCHDVRFVPELLGVHVDLYANSNRKRLCFNKRNGLRLVRPTSRRLRDDATLYVDRADSRMTDDDGDSSSFVAAEIQTNESDVTYTRHDRKYRRVCSPVSKAFVFVSHRSVHVNTFFMLSKTMHVYRFENHRLVSKQKIPRCRVYQRCWLEYFWTENDVRLRKFLRWTEQYDSETRKRCYFCLYPRSPCVSDLLGSLLNSV